MAVFLERDSIADPSAAWTRAFAHASTDEPRRSGRAPGQSGGGASTQRCPPSRPRPVDSSREMGFGDPLLRNDIDEPTLTVRPAGGLCTKQQR